MHLQIEQHGDRFFCRLRTRDTVYLWADFFSEADARRWGNEHLTEAIALKERYDDQDTAAARDRA